MGSLSRPGAQERGGEEQTKGRQANGHGWEQGGEGAGGPQTIHWRRSVPLSAESRASGRGRAAEGGGTGGRGRRVINKGSHKDRDRCPGVSRGTTKETGCAVSQWNAHDTRNISRGPGGGEEVVRGRDQEGPSIPEIHSVAPETLSWGGGGVGAAPVTVGSG